MDLKILGERAWELVDLWKTHSKENRTQVIQEIHKNGLLAISVFSLLPPRDEGNYRNELAFMPVNTNPSPAAENEEETDLSTISDNAQKLAGLWETHNVENRAQVLREIHDNGALAIWVFDLLPEDGKSNSRNKLGNSLISLGDLVDGRKVKAGIHC